MEAFMSHDRQVFVRIMLRRCAEFFQVMSDNREQRLYYVLPIDQMAPYAYQHSSIRDIATVCDIMDLVQLFEKSEMELGRDTLTLFEKVVGNTIRAYHSLYEQGRFFDLPEGNIGDLGFLLLSLLKCRFSFPSELPENGITTQNQIIQQLIDRQRPNGSLEIFFNKGLKPYEQSSEAFYLPEALIGLIKALEQDLQEPLFVEQTIQKAIAYLCQEKNLSQHMAADNSTFYFNWQSQWLYHWLKLQSKKERSHLDLEASHLQNLVEEIQKTPIANKSFFGPVATVEVACYLEGLVHAQQALKMLNLFEKTKESWFSKEVDRSFAFLYEIQSRTLKAFKGGFPHSRLDNEARVDVAGHVLGGLEFI
jgi:hypothetical protein